MNIAAWISLIGVILAPLIALGVGWLYEKRREERRMKFGILHSLMQTRHDPIALQAIADLNSIDLIFAYDPGVKEAWTQFYLTLSDNRFDNEPGYALRDERRAALALEIAKVLGYSSRISTAEMSRIYRPTLLAKRQLIDQFDIDKRFADVTGPTPPPSAPVTSLDTVDQTLNGGNIPDTGEGSPT